MPDLARWRSGDCHLQGVVVCRAGSGDPARISVGQDRLILTCLSIGQECPLLPDGDQAIAIYREFVSGDRHLQRVVGPDHQILTCLPVCLEGGAGLSLAIARR